MEEAKTNSYAYWQNSPHPPTATNEQCLVYTRVYQNQSKPQSPSRSNGLLGDPAYPSAIVDCPEATRGSPRVGSMEKREAQRSLGRTVSRTYVPG